MQRWSTLLLIPLLAACAPEEEAARQDANLAQRETTVLETYDVSEFNQDLAPDRPTADVAFYVMEGGPVAWERLTGQIEGAKRIFGEAGIQIRVSQAMLVSVPEDWLRIEPFEIEAPIAPPVDPPDLYARLNERRARLTDRAEHIVTTVTSHYEVPENGVPAENAVHILTLAKAPIPYFDWDGTEWVYKTAGTAGMSFPPYYFADRIPADIRGFISLSSSGGTRTLAHELGHKLINVSHEGGDTCPAFTAYGSHLMLYGNGEEIGAGPQGRWQRERLQLSPFVYREIDGQAAFENFYQDGGIYRDGLYGDYAIDPPCGE